MSVARRVAAAYSLPLFIVLGAAGGGCGDINGGAEPFAGTVRYLAPSGDYELRLLEPPWLPISVAGMSLFVVPESGISLTVPLDSLTLENAQADALYLLQVIAVDDEATHALTAAAAAHSPPWDLTKKRAVRTVSGATGAEVAWQEAGSRYHREAFVGAVSTRSYHLQFTAKRPVADDEMIGQMIFSFTPRGSAQVMGARD